MAKSESSKAAAGVAAATTTTSGAPTPKKKSAAKPRKRKISDAGASAKSGHASAKKAATDDSKSDRAGSKTAAGGASGADAHAPVVPTIKPFVKGELMESIKNMMFGFGDDADPLDESTSLMEDLVVEYVQGMTEKAMEMALIKGKLDTECFIFLIRKDPERYERIKELLRANDEFRAVLNSGFDPSDEKMY